MENSIEKSWTDLYLSNADIIAEGLSPVMNLPRGAALESFNLLGIPPKGSGHGDRYHYTDLRPAFEGGFEHYFTPSYPQVRPEEIGLEQEVYRITFLNGFCRDARPLTRLDNGVVFGSLAAAVQELPELVARYYEQLTDTQHDASAALNTVFAQDGAFIYVPRGERLSCPVVVSCSYYAEEESVAVFGRNLFIFETGSQAQVVMDYHTLSSDRFLGCHTREVFAEPGSRVELAELYRINAHSSLVSDSYVMQRRDSRFGSMSVALGGTLIRGTQTVYLAEPGAENHTNGLMLAGSGEHFDFTTGIEHLSPDCTSHEHFKGIAAGDGTSVFCGRIYVAQDAQHTEAYQQNNNLLLSDDAHVYTKPQLEIYADDVKCSHGATVGQLDDEAVYYMRQRGIGEETARRLQMYGFVNEVIGKTGIEGMGEMIDRLASEKIDRF